MKQSMKVLSLAVLLLIVTVQAHAAGYHVGGKVVTSSGRPAASVWVLVFQDNAEKGRALTGDGGKYRIDNLPEGTYTVVVKRQKKTVFRQQIRLPKDKQFDVRLP